ncbi:MAG: hypothetical protein ACI4VJ_00960 [Methanosphaera sp.]
MIISIVAVIISQNTTHNTTNNTTNNNTLNDTTTNRTQKNTTNHTTTQQKSISSINKHSDDDEYGYSPEIGKYVKEWRDSNGHYHVVSRDGSYKLDMDEQTGYYEVDRPEVGHQTGYM